MPTGLHALPLLHVMLSLVCTSMVDAVSHTHTHTHTYTHTHTHTHTRTHTHKHTHTYKTRDAVLDLYKRDGRGVGLLFRCFVRSVNCFARITPCTSHLVFDPPP